MGFYVSAWFGLLVVAVLNGAVRQFTFGRHLSELRAHQWSTLLGVFLISGAVWWIIGYRPPHSGAQALGIGLLWSALTVAFETFMGRVLSKRSWPEVWSDYDLRAGRVWLLFLGWLALAPWVAYHLVRGTP